MYKRQGSDFPELEGILKQISDQGIGSVTKQQETRLKNWRRKASELRSAWKLFDRDHEVPKDFATFVWAFGKLNDAIENDLPDMGIEYVAKILNGATFADLASRVQTFRAAEPKTVLGKVIENLRKVDLIMQGETVTVSEFHDVRKLMKDIMNFYKLRSATRLSAEVYATADWLHRLNKKLGDLHDDWLASALQGQINYHEHRVAFPPDIARDIREFLSVAHGQPL